MTLTEFATLLAGTTFAGVTTKLSGIPRELKTAQLPAQWTDLPSASITPDDGYSTFSRAATTFTGTLYFAVAQVTEGLPDAQRTAVLTMADTVQAWAEASPYVVEIETTRRIPVAAVEYRGVIATVTAPDME